MLRKALIAVAAGVAGYVIGVRAGFDAGVRDYLENESQMLDAVAIEKDKFDYGGEAERMRQLEQMIEERDEDDDDSRNGGAFQ